MIQTPAALFEVGTIASVLQLLKLPDGTVKVLVEGASRARIAGFTNREDFYEAMVEHVPARSPAATRKPRRSPAPSPRNSTAT